MPEWRCSLESHWTDPSAESAKPLDPEVRIHELEAIDPGLRVLSLPAEPAAYPVHVTPAETEVARRLIRGACRRTIAEVRGVSVHTVDAQIRSLLQKLGADSSSELVAHLGRSRS